MKRPKRVLVLPPRHLPPSPGDGICHGWYQRTFNLSQGLTQLLFGQVLTQCCIYNVNGGSNDLQ